MNELKDRLKSARKAANKTQAEVANAVGTLLLERAKSRKSR